MLEFRLSVPNAKDIAFRMERFGVQLTGWRAAWPSVTRRLAVMLAGQFELEGGRGSRGGWPPLSPRYARRKQKRYPGRPVLQAGGRLRGSLVGKSADTVEALEPGRMKFGTSVPYAIFHQTGTRKMPARPIFDPRREDRVEFQNALREEALEFVQALGFAIALGSGKSSASRLSRFGLGAAALTGGPGADLIGGM
ncbi:MAG: hypothetical protein DMG23_11815 [Acidobacteria bacterium]|nr:MAG: hypothetical protein DMG23_11815 [Acidobacteriota bacterium]